MESGAGSSPIGVGVIVSPGARKPVSQSLMSQLSNTIRHPSSDVGVSSVYRDMNTDSVLAFVTPEQEHHLASGSHCLCFSLQSEPGEGNVRCQTMVATFSRLQTVSSSNFQNIYSHMKSSSKLKLCKGEDEVTVLSKLPTNLIVTSSFLIEILDNAIIYKSRNCSLVIDNGDDNCDKCKACTELFQDISSPDIDNGVINRNLKHVDEQCNQNFIPNKFDNKDVSTNDNELEHENEIESRHEKEACYICGKVYRKGTVMVGHLKTHKEGSFVCNVCGAKFNVKSYLSRHMKAHDKMCRKYDCDFCDEKFLRPYLLKQHQEFTHKKNLPFQCSECGKKLRSNTLLKIHTRSVHKKEKPFPCEVCGFCSSRVDNLNIHRRKVHNLSEKISRSQLLELVKTGKHPFCENPNAIPQF